MATIVNQTSRKNKHLTLDDRITIEHMLKSGANFKEIAAVLGKDPSTISREIRHNLIFMTNSFTRYDEQGRIVNEVCPKLARPPYVCNACHRFRHCRCRRFVYMAKKAQKRYELLLRDARTGIPLNSAEFYEYDRVLSTAIKNGQHLYQALSANEIPIPVSTAYRYAANGFFSFTAMDLPRKVSFKHRKHRSTSPVPSKAKKGHTYQDFLAYISKHDITDWVEMDTVEGRRGGKVILTLDFTICNFMVGILLGSKTALAVTDAFSGLRRIFHEAGASFADIFPVILTDNGPEFSNIKGIENNEADEQESHLFFCEPMQSCQKAHVEKNHTLLRDICPKRPRRTSFDNMTQANMNVIFSHMNSTARPKLHGKTPYQLFCCYFGEEMASLLGIREVPAKAVMQSSRLLKIMGITQ